MTNEDQDEFLEEILTDAERVLTLIKAFRYAKTDDLNFSQGEDDLIAGCAEDILKRLCVKITERTENFENEE